MENLDIVKILGVGLSGFGFLLMFLAYKLIDRVIGATTPQQLVVKTINRYMLVCFVMTLTVGTFTFISTSYKNDLIAEQYKKNEDNTKAINILAASSTNSSIADSIIRNPQDNETALVAKKEQKKVLDTLSKYITEQNDGKVNVEFENYKTQVLKISDSLQMKNLAKPKIDSLKAHFLQYNNTINKYSLKLVNKVRPDLKLVNSRGVVN